MESESDDSWVDADIRHPAVASPMINRTFSSPSSTALLGQSLRVLVVEDNVDLARITTLLLRHLGFEVVTLHDGHSVLATARTFRPHFILLDIGLPFLDGFEVAKLLRGEAMHDDCIIIAISAFDPSMYHDLWRQVGFDHYLRKPIEFDDLLNILIS